MSDLSFGACVLIAFLVLLVYLFATSDNQYVMLADRPKQWESKRQSINNYAWKGPMFVEDFRNFTGDNNPLNEVTPTGASCDIPKYNKNVPGALECHKYAVDKCHVPSQTSEDGWRNEYHNAPYNLSQHHESKFKQITNNNLSAPNNLKSAQMRSIMGDWFDPYDKVSPWCYTELIGQCTELGGVTKSS